MNIIEPSRRMTSCQRTVKTLSYTVIPHSAGSREFYFLDDIIKLKMAKKVSGHYY